jgi:hypothetical protein
MEHFIIHHDYKMLLFRAYIQSIKRMKKGLILVDELSIEGRQITISGNKLSDNYRLKM